jgi:hypothetical protein
MDGSPLFANFIFHRIRQFHFRHSCITNISDSEFTCHVSGIKVKSHVTVPLGFDRKGIECLNAILSRRDRNNAVSVGSFSIRIFFPFSRPGAAVKAD